MVVIDGPPAFTEAIAESRYGAIPFVKDRLTDRYSILLDDANRAGERCIMKLWEEWYGFPFRVYNERIGVSRQGGGRNSHPSFVTLPYSRFKAPPTEVMRIP